MSWLGTEKSALQHTEEGAKFLAPIRTHIGEIQAKIDVLRKDGSDQVQKLKNCIQLLKEDRHVKKERKDILTAESNAALSAAQAVESRNQAEVAGLVTEAESYSKEHYEKDYLGPASENYKRGHESIEQRYQVRIAKLGKEYEQEVQRLRKKNAPDLQQELKDENHVHKNKLFGAKVTYKQELQAIKDKRHEVLVEQYHTINLLRMSRFTLAQEQAQRIESYRYTLNQRQFLLRNGLYTVIVMIFIVLSIVTPIVKSTQPFTYNNILNILQQASPHMFLAFGVAGLILLIDTDLSIGRMTGMGMIATAIIVHKGVNTGAVFGRILDFTSLPYVGRMTFTLPVRIILTTCFTSVTGFFTVYFKVHLFISAISNMLIMFGLMTYVIKGMSFGAIEPSIALMIIPKVNSFPLIILQAIAATVVVRSIWNKIRFGRDLYAAGGNPEATSASGISVFVVTMDALTMAGALYDFDAWLECARMVGPGLATYSQGWDMGAIAACVADGVPFTGDIGKISGVVVDVPVSTAFTYSLTILSIDANLQSVFESTIILTAVTLDCSKYVQER